MDSVNSKKSEKSHLKFSFYYRSGDLALQQQVINLWCYYIFFPLAFENKESKSCLKIVDHMQYWRGRTKSNLWRYDCWLPQLPLSGWILCVCVKLCQKILQRPKKGHRGMPFLHVLHKNVFPFFLEITNKGLFKRLVAVLFIIQFSAHSALTGHFIKNAMLMLDKNHSFLSEHFQSFITWIPIVLETFWFMLTWPYHITLLVICQLNNHAENLLFYHIPKVIYSLHCWKNKQIPDNTIYITVNFIYLN